MSARVVLRAIIFLFGLAVPFSVFSDQKDIGINEIAAYESTDREWIEIFNKGNNSVDITGWKFYEHGTNHALTLFRGSFVIGPGTYAIIANDGKKVLSEYPSFKGTIIDSSWQGLSEKGEEIGLKDKNGMVVEKFTYIPAPKASLERIDPVKVDYTSVNWKERTSGNSIGGQNGKYVLTKPAPEQPFAYTITVPQESSQKGGGPAKNIPHKKATSRSLPAPVPEHIRSKPLNSLVRSEGIVFVEPGILGANRFYVGGPDIQIWNEKKDFPVIHRGDRVSISGVYKKHGAEVSLKVKGGGDIHVLAHNQTVEPRALALKDISHDVVGSFVSVKGGVTGIRWPSFHLADGSADVRVSIEKGTHIPNLGLKKGDQITVQGIVSETQSGVRILPRDVHDITIAPSIVKADGGDVNISSQPYGTTRQSTFHYFTISLSLSAMLATGLGLEYVRLRKEKKTKEEKPVDSEDGA